MMIAKAARLEVAAPPMFRGDFWRTRDYPGYTTHESWNGWACPYFERAAADQIMVGLVADAKEAGGMLLFYHDDDGCDVYNIVQQSDDAEPDLAGTATGIDLVTSDGVRRVYPIGASLWTWQEAGVHFDRGEM